MDSRKLWEAAGNGLVTLLTGLLVYKGFTDLSADSFYQTLIQGLLVALGALGFQNIKGKAE